MNLKRLLRPPYTTTNYRQEKKIRQWINKFPRNCLLIDAGGGNRHLGDNILNIDLEKKHHVDIVASLEHLPVKDSQIDGILCTGVLEHVKYPETVVSEFYRSLKPKGSIYVSIPFMQGYHPSPGDYRRYTIEGIRLLFSDFKEIEVSNTRGSASTLAGILKEFFSILISFNNDKIYKFNKIFFGWIFFSIKYLDHLLEKNKFDYLITSSFTYIGKKISSSSQITNRSK